VKVRLAVLALVALSAMSCHKKDEASAAPPAGGKGGKGARGALTFTVDVLPVESKRVDYLVLAPGTIDAFERVQVTARVAGVVDRVLFTEGQEVKKGKALVVIDAERYSLSVAQAKAALDKAKALQSDAEAQIARREAATTDHPGLITGEEIATIKTKGITAKADSEVAAQAVRTAQVNLRDSTVSAPIAGVIQTRTVETGQYVQAGYVMATLLRSDPMLLHFQVEPDDAPRLKPGMLATFRMRETDRTFTAKISLVSGAADIVTHMIGVTGEVLETEHKFWLRPGSFCDVSVNVGASRDAPLIPRSAARATDHGYVAFVIENDVAKERPLNLGMSTKDGWVEVRSGLKAGEMLVVRGAEPLSTGAHVKANKVTPDSLKVDAPAAAASGDMTATAAPPVPPPAASDAAPAAPHGSGRRGPKAPGATP
jgi:RND family efflux transporter MFP subunit